MFETREQSGDLVTVADIRDHGFCTGGFRNSTDRGGIHVDHYKPCSQTGQLARDLSPDTGTGAGDYGQSLGKIRAGSHRYCSRTRRGQKLAHITACVIPQPRRDLQAGRR